MSVQAKMTILAGQVRSLSGRTEALGLDDMIVRTAESNAEVLVQADLIRQIQEAMVGLTGTAGTLFSSKAGGMLPTVYRGRAGSGFTPEFGSSATGALQEG